MVADHGNTAEARQRASSRHADEDRGSDRHPAWYRRPSATWILCMKALYAVAGTMTAGPRLEMFRELVCRSYIPGLVEPTGPPNLLPNTTTAASIVNYPASFIEAYFSQSNQAYTSIRLHEAAFRGFTPIMDCASNSRVQADVAKLVAVITIISGILSCLSTGWWGGFLDRYGRTRTLGIIVLAPLATDFLTFFVFFFSDVLPGKHWFFVIAPVIEGLLGVPSSTMTAETSYMRDVSEPHNLSRNFSLLSGIFYMGLTIGPVLGGFLNQQTNSIMAAFYAATLVHVTYATIAWFVMPESITESAMALARNRYANELASVADADVGPVRRQVMTFTKAFWDSFPLNVLTPKRRGDSRRKRDWNLTWLAISAALINAVTGSLSSVHQYALYVYQWSSLDLGYFISATGLSTVLFLTIIFPAAISVFRGKAESPRHVDDTRRNTLLDLNLLRASTIFLAAGYALMGIAPTGLIFTLCFVISTFGLGFLPTIQSLAAILHTNASGEEDTGRLFGALGVVFALGGRILGPALYGTVYVETVSFFAPAIFWLSVGCSLTALLVLAFIRPPESLSDMDPEERCDGLADHVDHESDPLLGGSTR